MSGIVGKNLGRGSGIVTATPVGADAIDGSNIADDAIDSEHYTDGSIDNAHIADDAIDSEHYAAGSIDEAHIADNAVTLAKMAGGTDGNIISFDAAGDPVAIATGSDGQVLTSTGAGSPPAFEAAAGGGFTLGTEQASTSGTAITFGGIPSGIKLIYVILDGVSGSGTDNMQLDLGDAGGLETSGYQTATQVINTDDTVVGGSSTGTIDFRYTAASDVMYGIVTLALMDSTNNQWACNYMLRLTTAELLIGASSKSLSDTLTQLSLGWAASATFDAGSINIMYQ
jgi:hypothetical protein